MQKLQWTKQMLRRRLPEEGNPGVRVHVEGGGTESGVQALVEGRVDLATASRPLLPEEVRRLADRHGTVGLSIRCARDGLAVYLNPGNPVRDQSGVVSAGQYRTQFLAEDRPAPRNLALTMAGQPVADGSSVVRGQTYLYALSAEDNYVTADKLGYSYRLSKDGGASFGAWVTYEANKGLSLKVDDSIGDAGHAKQRAGDAGKDMRAQRGGDDSASLHAERARV